MADADSRLAQGSPFWRFSLQFYRQTGVADACIALQEESGVDVNLLLFLLWHATERRVMARADVESLETKIGGWRDATVIPLRGIRRALKTPPGLVTAGATEDFRNKIKAVELEAERLQQEAMYSLVQAALLGQQVSSPEEAARGSIRAYESMARAPFSKVAIEILLSTFAQTQAEPAQRRGDP